MGESNQGQTMIVSSTLGADDWVAFDSLGGTLTTDGPLQMPVSPTPSGSFKDLGHDRGYGKLHIPGDDSVFYLAINPVASSGLPPVELETAFTNPENWTWHDSTTGLPTSPILIATTEHDLREAWLVPNSDPNDAWKIVYTADFGPSDGGKALGYAGPTPSAALSSRSPHLASARVRLKPEYCSISSRFTPSASASARRLYGLLR